MPKPVHIICSQSGVEDKITNLASLFHVLETVQFSRTPQPNLANAPLVQMQITATWIRESGDEEQLFDFETRILLPPDGAIFPAGQGTLQFTGNFHRTTARIFGALPIVAGGTMRIQHRIKKVGEENWLTQECPVIVDEIPSATVDPSVPSNH